METSFLAHRSGRIFNPTTLDGEPSVGSPCCVCEPRASHVSLVLPDNWYEDRDQHTGGECGGVLFPTSVEKGTTVSPCPETAE